MSKKYNYTFYVSDKVQPRMSDMLGILTSVDGKYKAEFLSSKVSVPLFINAEKDLNYIPIGNHYSYRPNNPVQYYIKASDGEKIIHNILQQKNIVFPYEWTSGGDIPDFWLECTTSKNIICSIQTRRKTQQKYIHIVYNVSEAFVCKPGRHIRKTTKQI